MVGLGVEVDRLQLSGLPTLLRGPSPLSCRLSARAQCLGHSTMLTERAGGPSTCRLTRSLAGLGPHRAFRKPLGTLHQDCARRTTAWVGSAAASTRGGSSPPDPCRCPAKHELEDTRAAPLVHAAWLVRRGTDRGPALPSRRRIAVLTRGGKRQRFEIGAVRVKARRSRVPLRVAPHGGERNRSTRSRWRIRW